MRYITAIALLALTSPVFADRKTEEIALAAATAADIITTEIWLAHEPYEIDGVTHFPAEGGMVLSRIDSRAGRIAVKAGGAVGLACFARFMEKKGHDRVGSIIRLTGISVWSGAAGWNLSLTIRY